MSNSLSFDLTLAEWKSHAQLSETSPLETIHHRKQIMLFAEELDAIPEPPIDRTPITEPRLVEDAPPKQKNNKLFFNFNKSVQGKSKMPSRPSETSCSKNWIKPTLYTLSKEVKSPKETGLKQIRLNFPR